MQGKKKKSTFIRRNSNVKREFSSRNEGHASLSLVVPIHGELGATRRFLDSFIRQTKMCPLSFVDDRSPDDSVQWLRARGWTVEVPAERLWFNGIVNRAVETCDTPLLGLVNNDVVLGKWFVEYTVNSFENTDYDILVPLTLPRGNAVLLDKQKRFRIGTLWRQQGWCMLFRTDSLRRLPPIPDDLRLWYGDSWIFHHAWAAGMKTGVMLHNRILHERGRTIRAAQKEGVHPVIRADEEVYRDKYPWLRKRQSLGFLRLVPRPLRKILFRHY